MSRLSRIASLATISCLFTLHVWGQVTSIITGTVTDPNAAAVPQAQILVTNTDTNIGHTAQSKNDGSYEVTQLPVGPYKIEVRKDGFQTYVQSGIVLQLNTNPT